MTMSGAELQSTPTDPKKEERSPQIPEVPSILIPYLVMDFERGYLSLVKEDSSWEVDHYIDKTHSTPLKIISLSSYKEKKKTYQAVAEEGHEDTRAIRIIERSDYNSNTIRVLEILTKGEDNDWTTLSSDQTPSDLQL